jgi:hypothetical protein
MHRVYCLGCRKPISTLSEQYFHLIEDNTEGLCPECYDRMKSGSEPYGSPLCRRVVQSGAVLLLLPGNRVRFALPCRTQVWRSRLSIM